MNKSMLCAGLLALVAAQSANADDCIWTGGGTNSNWSNSANWNCTGAHTVPADGDSLGFPTAVPRLTNNNDLVKLMADQLVIAGPVNISGNTIGLSGGISAGVPLAAATSPVVSLGIVLEGAQTFECSAAHKPLTLGGTINLNDQALMLDSGCSIFLTGKITAAGSIAKIGTGTVFLEGSTSNYTGQTTIYNGRVRLVSSAALGASGVGNETFVNASSALELEDVAIADDLTVLGTGISNQGVLLGAAGNNTLTGTITLAGSSTINAAAGTLLTIEGVIGGGSVSLTKIGAGTLVLQGDNTYNGTTIADNGWLEVNGSVKVAAMNTGATVAGNGVATSGISLQAGGAFSPGTAVGTNTGTFDTANVVWNGGGTMAFQLGPDSARSDHLVSTNFNGGSSGVFEFQFSDGARPPVPGTTYALVSFNTTNFVVGAFSFTYFGTGPGSSMTGTFAMTPTELQFTPTTVVSDLVFHDGFE